MRPLVPFPLVGAQDGIFPVMDASGACSYVSAGWGVGSILGSAIGGTLSEPCGVLFSGDALCGEDRGVFTLFPYLLPCLIAVALTCISFVTFALSFGETLKWPGGLFGQPYSRLSTSSSLASVAADQRESRDEGEFDDKAGDERWYKDRNTVLCLSGYVAIALAHIVHDEVSLNCMMSQETSICRCKGKEMHCF